jgi:hypothetical protein
MLNIRITRGPLRDAENHVILSEYNRLTGVQIPMEEFAHWVQASPAGAAWHALLETDDGRIVGHTSVFPLRVAYENGQLIPAKSEYSFVHEDSRKEKIRGYETVSRPAFIILLDQLFQHAQQQGWGPIFASTNEKNQIFTRKVGLRPLEFPLRECLLVLRPVNAARHTPNLQGKQRAALFAAGMAQTIGWSVAGPILRNGNHVRTMPISAVPLESEPNRLAFFEDVDSLRWRYQERQYIRYEIQGGDGDYLIAKRGSKERYLRVCQYRLRSAKHTHSLVAKMIAQARADGAIGLRWAVYEQLESADEIVGSLRKLGFLCPRRIRIVMVHKNFAEFMEPAAWRMNDSHFTYDP